MLRSSMPVTMLDRMRKEHVRGCDSGMLVCRGAEGSETRRRDSEYISGGRQRLEPPDRGPRTQIYGRRDGYGMKRTGSYLGCV